MIVTKIEQQFNNKTIEQSLFMENSKSFSNNNERAHV